MRNLKKILALVLALVMSLSLMATAGAADFSDKDQITADYTEATEVLNGLGVFQGYDNGARFEPQGQITRAEVAAIVYRIATGDTKDSQKTIYTTYNQFKDVVAGSWYEGYVTYCANAGYIKGRDSKTFDPQGKVTGYEALAMILRAVGYDKNNEFTGSNWQLHTASIAKKLDITKNIANTVQLSQPATREVVAELLFQSILCKTVTYNAAIVDYTPDAKTLAEQTLGMEKIEGVVVANEIANLNGTKALAEGRTELADGRTLSVTSTLDNIGEASRYYAIKNPQNVYEPVVDKMYRVDDCKTVENEYKGTSVSDLAKKGNMTTNASTLYYTDYDDTNGSTTSDWRIRYIIDVTELAKLSGYSNYDALGANGKHTIVNENDGLGTVVTVTKDNQNQFLHIQEGHLAYERIINIGKDITVKDQDLIFEIFDNADKYTSATVVGNFSLGEVYAGTQSNDDLSDRMSHAKFVETYYKGDAKATFSKVGNGEYLKLTDVDNDGVAEYALKRQYTLSEVIQVRNDNKDVYYTNMDGAISVNYIDGYTPVAGEKVLLNKIEGKWYGEAVEPTVATIKTVNVKDEKVFTTDGAEYEESDISNKTELEDIILIMDEKVEYNLYLDKGGYIRAYELAQGSQYGLLTEMYPTSDFNGALVTNANWIVELMTGADKYPAEYKVLNSYVNRAENDFIDGSHANPFRVAIGGVLGSRRNSYLQQAIAHLGFGAQTDFTVSGNNGTDNNDGREFKYINGSNRQESWTNVARYVKSDDGVTLNTATQRATKGGEYLYYAWHDANQDETAQAAELYNVTNVATMPLKGVKITASEWRAYANAQNTKGANLPVEAENFLVPVYSVDYIKLSNTQAISAKAKHYDIAATNNNFATENYGTAYGEQNNRWIDTLSTTEFYLISAGGNIRYFKGYENMPAISKDYIRAAYAVAENTAADNHSNDYWVGRVVVIELNDGYSFEDIALLTPYSKTTVGALSNGAERQSAAGTHTYVGLSTLSNGTFSNVNVNDTTWGYRWNVGIYGLNGVVTEDNGANITASTMTPITSNFNVNHVYAGTIARDAKISIDGYYDIVWTNENGELQHKALPGTSRFYGVGTYAKADAGKGSDFVRILGNDAGRYVLDKEIQENDRVIYVTNASGSIAYVIDVDYHGNTSSDTWNNNTTLRNLWADIDEEQRTLVVADDVLSSIQVKGKTAIMGENDFNGFTDNWYWDDIDYTNYVGAVYLSSLEAQDTSVANFAYTLAKDVNVTSVVVKAYDDYTDTRYSTYTGTGNDKGTTTDKSLTFSDRNNGNVPDGRVDFIVTLANGRVVTYRIFVFVDYTTGAALTELYIKGVKVDLARLNNNYRNYRLVIDSVANNSDTAQVRVVKNSVADTVTVTIPGVNSGNPFDISAVTNGALPAGKYNIYVTVTGKSNTSTTYTIPVSVADYAGQVTFTGANKDDNKNVALKVNGKDYTTAISVDERAGYSFTLASANKAYYVGSDTKVTYTVGGGSSVTLTRQADGTWFIPASALSQKDASGNILPVDVKVVFSDMAVVTVEDANDPTATGIATISGVKDGTVFGADAANTWYVIPGSEIQVQLTASSKTLQNKNTSEVYKPEFGQQSNLYTIGAKDVKDTLELIVK